MTKEDAIKYLQQLYPNGGHCWLDEQRIEAISMAINALQEEPVSEQNLSNVERTVKNWKEPVSEELEDAANDYGLNIRKGYPRVMDETDRYICNAFKDGAKWKVENLWKPADGDDMPEIDREVIALLDNGKIVFAHRPPEYWDGKNIATGKVTRYYPKTYDNGGWNIPDVKFWLDYDINELLCREK